MRRTTLPSFITFALIPIIISVVAFVSISNLDKKFRNPYYQKVKTTHAGGVIVKGVPIPLAAKKAKAQPLSYAQMRSVKTEFKKESYIENIANNKKWYRLTGLRSLLSIIAWGSLIIGVAGMYDSYKKYMNYY